MIEEAAQFRTGPTAPTSRPGAGLREQGEQRPWAIRRFLRDGATVACSAPAFTLPEAPLTRTPIRFELTFDVADEDIDRLGHVNNVVYLRWIQDVAARHWRTAVSEEETRGTVWVVVRHEIDYVQPAGPGDRVIARTWVGEARGATWDRHTEIVRASDGQVLSRALSVWCPLNANTRRPTRLSPELRAGFYESS